MCLSTNVIRHSQANGHNCIEKFKLGVGGEDFEGKFQFLDSNEE